MDEAKSEKARNTAVIVFHGMGKQVPFETLGEVAERIRILNPLSAGDPDPKTVAENVPCRAPEASPDATLPRIRMTCKTGKPDGVRNIDFYESYWAPVTAGKVSLMDALVFLIQGGIAGIGFTFPLRFSRYFWSSVRAFPLPIVGNLSLLSGSLAIVGSLAGLILGLGFAIQSGAWKEYLAALSFLFRALHLAALPILLAALLKPRPGPGSGGWARAALAAAFLAGLLSFLWAVPPGFLTGRGFKAFSGTFAGGAKPFLVLFWIFVLDVLLLVLAAPKIGTRLFKPGLAPTFFSRVVWLQSGLSALILVLGVATACVLALRGAGLRGLDLGGAALIWTYGIAGAIVVTAARKFLVEYVGDLAAYLSSQKASKFSEIRRQIQADAFKVAGHVFASRSSRNPDVPEYSEVMFVGHSLGSVIAYDTLNGIINQDLIHLKGLWKASERTRLLLTFGSPLDKTAFIFRAQVKDNLCREMLASAKQPLLEENHAYRPAAWVNVWSPCDIISGPLDFYDRGKLAPAERIGDADSYAFTYDDADPPQPVAVVTAIPGARPDRRPRPVVSLIDPQADIPFAAHTQFWKNDLIYRILSKALQDPGDGSIFGNFIRITAPGLPKTP